MLTVLVLFILFLLLVVVLTIRHRKDSRERKKYELTVTSKPFTPPSTRNQEATALKIYAMLAVWLVKKNSIYSIEKQNYIDTYLSDRFRLSYIEVQEELQPALNQSIHIRSVANWVTSSLVSKEERMELIEFLISMLYAAKTDIIDREFTALVRFAELIGVQAVYVENRIIDHRRLLLGEAGVNERWHKFTNKQVRRKLALAVLGLLGDASDSEIKMAYRTLVKQYHPDRLINLSDEEKSSFENRFLEIQEAYEELGQQQ